MKASRTGQIIDLLRTEGKKTTRDISERLDVPENQVRVYISRLRDSGLVFEVGNEGHYKIYSITESLEIKPRTKQLLSIIKETVGFEDIDTCILHLVLRYLDTKPREDWEDKYYYLFLSEVGQKLLDRVVHSQVPETTQFWARIYQHVQKRSEPLAMEVLDQLDE